MSKSRRDILDTEAMLTRLTNLLVEHAAIANPLNQYPCARADAESLRRISMTLRRWHELECGNSDERGAWAIVRGYKDKHPTEPRGYVFRHDDDGKSFVERHVYRWTRDPATGQQVNSVSTRYDSIPDREAGARKRLAAILKRYPTLTAYVQTDPRGCALYILKPGDVPEGCDVSSYYSRGLAVFQ